MFGSNLHTIDFDVGGVAQVRDWCFPRSKVLPELDPKTMVATRRLAWCKLVHPRLGDLGMGAMLAMDLVELAAGSSSKIRLYL